MSSVSASNGGNLSYEALIFKAPNTSLAPITLSLSNKLPDNYVLVKNRFAGINFIDIYQRGGVYQHVIQPFLLGQSKEHVLVLGMEGAGVVHESNSNKFAKGDLVAYLNAGGAFGQYTLVPAAKCFKLEKGKDEIASLREGAAYALQGMTAVYLCTDTVKVEPGQWVMVHAAAGGTGHLIASLAKHMGARVIGTTTTPAKLDIIKKFCDEALLLNPIGRDDASIVQQVKKVTGGHGVDIIYDGVGKCTFPQLNLALLAKRGHLVSFGDSSGSIEPLDPNILAPKCASLHRVALFFYTETEEEFQELAKKTFDLVKKGVLKSELTVYDELGSTLKDRVELAHADLQSKRSQGKLVIEIPQ